MRSVFIKNSLNGQRDALTPLEPGHIKLYACGVTVYDDCHIGHAMQAIFFDVIRRYLEFAGYKVTYVRNYTDVDDKIINRASERNMSPRELSESMIASSEKDMNDLGVRPPSHAPKVSECIPEIIELIETLIKNNAAYATPNGDVYYRVRSKSDYGKLSNRKIDELQAGARISTDDIKEDPLDFALWKNDTTQDASWDSPWGPGRPGWHIECSAMSHKFLGPNFDLHGGGRDLIFPHHENEIAQSESAHGGTYAQCWIHSGLLTIEHQKMSKSLGNSVTIQQFLADWPAEVLRLAYLHNQYGSNVDLSHDVFSLCRKKLFYAYETLQFVEQRLKDKNVQETSLDDEIIEEFHKSMCDDFNTPVAMSVIYKCLKRSNQLLSMKQNQPNLQELAKIYNSLREISPVLGLYQAQPEEFLSQLKQQLLNEMELSENTILSKIEQRTQARSDKDWKKSDEIRDELLQLGISLCDRPSGTTWGIVYDEGNS